MSQPSETVKGHTCACLVCSPTNAAWTMSESATIWCLPLTSRYRNNGCARVGQSMMKGRVQEGARACLCWAHLAQQVVHYGGVAFERCQVEGRLSSTALAGHRRTHSCDKLLMCKCVHAESDTHGVMPLFANESVCMLTLPQLGGGAFQQAFENASARTFAFVRVDTCVWLCLCGCVLSLCSHVRA